MLFVLGLLRAAIQELLLTSIIQEQELLGSGMTRMEQVKTLLVLLLWNMTVMRGWKVGNKTK